MKTKEELNEIKEEIERLDKKLQELTEEELEQVTGGRSVSSVVGGGDVVFVEAELVGPGGFGGKCVVVDGGAEVVARPCGLEAAGKR